MLDAQLPTTPDIGFLGRDETLLAIDRAFDNHAIVLLHAFAGSGKTSVAAEFGRWYALTGGLLESGRQGYVLFTSFQRYLSLSRVLDKLGQVFERDLERSGIHWLSLSDEQRRTVALQVLSKVPVLWIWDNVEPIAGFPDGETQRWSEAEQQELADFLRDARNTKAKFLLTSRRDEREWLGDLPARVRVPPMPMQERVQFAYALAEKHGYGSVDVGNWLPLLRYSQGNPLTITVVVSQALRNGYRSKEHIEKFVADLRSGEAELDDDESEGRSLSLGASLSYGFTNSFSSQECKHLALLHFFRECVWGETFHLMSLQRTDGWLVPMEELTLESVTNLLDRAAAVGLLGVASLQGSEVKYYDIHPALPWYFQKLFEKYYPISASSPTEITQELAAKAFVAAIAWAGNAAYNRYVNGIRLAIVTLVVEEANLLYARNLSKLNGWWDHVLEATQGLLGLYKETGRYLEWAKLIDELQLDFIDQTTLLPMSGRKQMWHVVVGHYTLLAERTGQLEQLEQAEKMLLNVVNDLLPQVCEITKDSVKLKDPKCYNVVQSLAITKEAIGRISYQRGKDVCLSLFQEALSLCEKIHDKMEQAILFFQMGHAYLYLDTLRDFEKAEECYQQSLKLGRKDDDLWQGKCLNQLGRIHYDCFFKCRRDNHPEDKCLYHLNNSAHYYHKSLSILPSYALDDLSVAHGSLGIIYGDVGDINRCLLHHQKAIRYMEQLGNNESAAHTRYSAAFFLAHAGRIADALIYAESAILGYTKLGNIAAAEIQRIKNWMSKIQRSG
ncbi:MAG: ATP-binding protein [Leptolyngbyaceae cyanobacterium RM2_2_4]|nr:ATP-binding protein [Leptolyngbyaceae cyanobacterium RM2_2_4]